MKVLLINPVSGVESRQGRKEPLGICYISAYLRKHGHSTRVVDQIDETNDEIVEIGHTFKPDIIGFSSMTYNYPNALNLAKRFKNECGNVTIIFGGTHASGMPEIVKEPAIDVVVIGEGELTTLELVNTLEITPTLVNLEHIKGISFLKDNNEVYITPPRERITDLDKLPFPDKSDLPMDKYRGLELKYLLNRRVSTIHIARGCSGHCTFCTTPMLYKDGWIARSAYSIVDEIQHLIRDYKVQTIFFADEDFMKDRNRVFEICDEIIKRKVVVSWFCFSKITDIEPTILIRMKQAGCINIMLGIESMHDESLKKIAKRTTVEETKAAIRVAHKTGLIIGGTYMIGYPWETYETLMSGLKELEKLKLDHIYLNYITPFPGTPFYKDCERKKLIGDYKFDYYDCYSPIVGAKLPEYLNGLDSRVFRKKMQKKLNYNIVYLIKVLRNIARKYMWYIIYKFR